MITFDQIRELLSVKFSKEKKRLKSYGTKANSFDLANAVARYVEALMAEARSRELVRLDKKLKYHGLYKFDKYGKIPIKDYIEERIHATSVMAKAIRNEGERNEAARPWKRREHKHKHGHRKYK
jgi:hypothetical protein